MAATIKQKLEIDSELIKGDNGIFDVVVDGKMIFSKDEEGRFPEEREILDLLAES